MNVPQESHSVAAPSLAGASLRNSAIQLGLVYWTVVFVGTGILWARMDRLVEGTAVKLVLFLQTLLITAAITFIQYRLRKTSFPLQAAMCLILAIAAALAYTAFDYGLYAYLFYPKLAELSILNYGYTLLYRTLMFFGWACLYVALLYSFEVRERERRLAASREEAIAAQMQALRYQVSPHFLFNTLNSIAGLIEEGAAAQAGRMVLSLSNFLRTTLTLDPMHDVPLAEEIALQEEYLEIEQERFSDRMRLKIDIPEAVRHALVPSLILQPLVENAVKHGIGNRMGTVNILLQAYREGQALHLVVENDMPLVQAPAMRPKGTGIGLKNVADRIQARFQEQGSFLSGSTAPGQYRAHLILPWREA